MKYDYSSLRFRYQIAAFVPERKGRAGQLDVFCLPDVTTATAGKAFFKASSELKIADSTTQGSSLIDISSVSIGDSSSNW